MKIIFMILIALGSHNVFASGRDVITECSLTGAQSTLIERVLLFALTDEIVIKYRDGSIEVFNPTRAEKMGLFAEDNFTTDLAWNNGQVYIPNSVAGPIYIKFNCYLTPTIPFERCVSQGSGDSAPFAGVVMNVNGKVLSFKGQNICKRTDNSPL